MLRKFHIWLKLKLPFLFDEKMPVWLTILVSLAAAFATYYLAPLYTRQFQVEDVRSAHLKSTIEKLNGEIIELSQKIRRFDSSLANKNENAVDLREDCLDLITKLQWRLVDLRVVLTQPEDEKYVTAVSDSLERLRVSLNASVTPAYREDVRSAMGSLAASTRDVLNRLYAKASLQG